MIFGDNVPTFWDNFISLLSFEVLPFLLVAWGIFLLIKKAPEAKTQVGQKIRMIFLLLLKLFFVFLLAIPARFIFEFIISFYK